MGTSGEILVNVTPREVRIATLRNHSLDEIWIERNLAQGIVGNIYKGKVQRILPGLQAAFIDIGLPRYAFLHRQDISSLEPTAIVTDLLHPGQEVMVQVVKDPIGNKGARVTMQFGIPARYLVLTPQQPEINISQKITDVAERERLQTLLQPTATNGYICRTAAAGVSAAAIEQDKAFLNQLWQGIQDRMPKAALGTLLYQEIPLVLRVIRDVLNDDISSIQVDDAATVDAMLAYAKTHLPDLAERIHLYTDPKPLFDCYNLEEEIQKALAPKVYLKAGGYLVFDQTEAMTTIDVNTGAQRGSQEQSAEMVFNTNLEAAEAIARQLRLRNLGGIIIIDFIDMEDPTKRQQLMRALQNAVANDRARAEISELSSLGLVQMTRKRTRESLEHILCTSCPLCQGRGSIKSLETISYDIFRALKRKALQQNWPGYLILAAATTIQYLTDHEEGMLTALKTMLGKPIILQVAPTYTQEQYDILPTE